MRSRSHAKSEIVAPWEGTDRALGHLPPRLRRQRGCWRGRRRKQEAARISKGARRVVKVRKKWEIWSYLGGRPVLLETFDSERLARDFARDFAASKGTTVRRSLGIWPVDA